MREVLLLLFSVVAFAANAQFFPVRQYTTYDGMPSSSIYDIDQSPSGLMWFVSASGPFHYNAKQWTEFPDSLELPKSINTRISIDDQNRVWIAGTCESNFTVQLYENEEWKKINTPDELREVKNWFFGFTSLQDDDKGAVSIGHMNHLYILQKETRKWKLIDFPDETIIHNIIRTEDGKQYVATSIGLFKLDNNKIERIYLSGSELPNSNIKQIASYDDELYILGDTWLAKQSAAGVELVSENVPANPLLKRNKSNLIIDQRGRIFSGYNRPPHYFEPVSGRWEKLLIDGLELNINSSRIFCDRENNLWVGDSRGLFKFNLLQFSNFNKNTGLGENEVTTISELKDGSVLLASQHYLNTFKNGIINSYLIDPELSQNFRVLDLYEDPEKGLLYVAASRGGLLIYRTGEYKKPLHRIFHPLGYVSVEKFKGKIFAATPTQLQIIENNKVKVVANKKSYIRNLSIIEDRLAISYGRNGIALFDGEKIDEFSAEKEGLRNVYKPVYYNGSILVGTKYGIGILKNDEIVQWEVFPYSVPCYSLLNVRDEELWIGTDQGVFRFNGKNTIQYGLPQGLVGVETNRNAFIQDSNDNIWIGMEKGASLFQAEKMNIPYYLAQAEITQVKTSADSPLSFSAINQLKASENTVSIFYQCLSYVREQDLHLRYQLYDPNLPEEAVWEEINSYASSELRFSNLSPGAYIFRIQAKNHGYDWGDIDEVRWVINQPFYNQIWFLLLTGLFAMILIGLIFRIRYMYLIRRQAKLEAIISQRTKEIQDLNENLEEKVIQRTTMLQERNKQLKEYAFINAHLLRNPLTRMMSILLLLKKDNPSKIEKNYLDLLEDSTKELDDVIHSINHSLSNGEGKNNLSKK